MTQQHADHLNCNHRDERVDAVADIGVGGTFNAHSGIAPGGSGSQGGLSGRQHWKRVQTAVVHPDEPAEVLEEPRVLSLQINSALAPDAARVQFVVHLVGVGVAIIRAEVRFAFGYSVADFVVQLSLSFFSFSVFGGDCEIEALLL